MKIYPNRNDRAMKRGRKANPINVQGTLLHRPNGSAKSEPSPFEDVIEITSHICEQKDVCQGCGRGDKYGIDLHFLLHYPDGALRTVCYTCGKTAAGKCGLRLPPTNAKIYERESKADMRLIRIARQKMEEKQNGNI